MHDSPFSICAAAIRHIRQPNSLDSRRNGTCKKKTIGKRSRENVDIMEINLGKGKGWSDEKGPSVVVFFPPCFMPRHLKRGQVRERRVGGSNAWHSEPAQSLFAPVPSISQEVQPTIFRSVSASFSGKSDEEAREMVGWNLYKIGRPQLLKEVELATIPKHRPTHPKLPNQAVADCIRNKFRQKIYP